MANGDNLPFQDLDVVPFTPITSEWGDGIGEDILALAAGTGLDDNAVTSDKIDLATLLPKIAVQVIDTLSVSTSGNSTTVNFGVTFASPPIAFVTPQGSGAVSQQTIWSFASVTTTSITVYGRTTAGSGTAGYSVVAIGQID